MKYYDAVEFKGKVLTQVKINENGDEIEFLFADSSKYVMFHYQDCCESVSIYDQQGKPSDLFYDVLVEAKEETSSDWPDDVKEQEYGDSYTWTIYTFATEKAKWVVRWLGTSNGYYSESIQIDKVE